ncbi:MAG: hypothetical protein BroJett003_10290 [Planctomycetota bacterium]|nr:MAG: hypothetical protein BroJett003_10290 [Planctomycetota bacterium]
MRRRVVTREATVDALQLGVDLDDLRLPIKEAVPAAARLGFRAIEFGLGNPELSEAAASQSGRRHFLRFAKDYGLAAAAASADFPGLRLTDAVRVEERIDRTRAVLQAAGAMHVPVVTAGVGALTDAATGLPSATAIEALRQIARDAERSGVIYAIRPSADAPEHLAAFLSSLDTPHVRLCLDPAAMLMSGTSPHRLLALRSGDVVLSHVRDATAGAPGRGGAETAIGEGDVDFLSHLMLLDASGYHGPHIVRRQTSEHPLHDLASAREYLARLQGELAE